MSANKESHFYVRDLLFIAWRRKWYAILPLVLGAAVGFACQYMITPVYRSSVTISYTSPVNLSADVERLIGAPSDRYQRDEDRKLELMGLQMEVTSAPYIAQLIQRMGLDKDPKIENKAGSLMSELPGKTVDELKFEMLLGQLRNLINTEFVGKNLVRISVYYSDPDQAASLAKNLGEIFMAERTKQELSSLRLSSDFTWGQLDKYEKDVQDKIDTKTQFETEAMSVRLNDMVANEANRKTIASEIQGTLLEIQRAKDEENNLEPGNAELLPNKRVLAASPDLIQMEKDVADALASMASFMQKYPWNASTIMNLKVKMYDLQKDMEVEVRRLVENQFRSLSDSAKESLSKIFSVRNRLRVLSNMSNVLQAALADLGKKISLVPVYDAKIEQAQREIDAARELRDRFKLQQEGTQISQALLQESKYRLVEPARAPLRAAWPDAMRLLLMGVFIGLAVGVGTIALVEFMDTSLKKIEEVEEYLHLDVVGTIPRQEGLGKIASGG